MPTLFTRMKRIFDKPEPTMTHSFQHFKARQRICTQSEDWHPVQAICVAVGGLSLLSLAAVVFLMIVAAGGSDGPSVEFLLALKDVMYGSACSFLGSALILVCYNRFKRD